MTLLSKILSGALLLVLAMTGLHYTLRHYTDPAVLGGHSASVKPIEIMIAETTLRIPQNIIRRKTHRTSGRHSNIDLYFEWPSLAGYSVENASIFENTASLDRLIFVSLTEISPPSPPERRLEGIYRRFFIGKPWRGPDGLTGQTLDPASGYQSEDVFYAVDGNETFVTRCLQQNEAQKSNVLPTCLFDFQLEKNVTVNVRFHRNLLPSWRQINARMKRQILSLRTP